MSRIEPPLPFYASRTTCHVSRITFHVRRITSQYDFSTLADTLFMPRKTPMFDMICIMAPSI